MSSTVTWAPANTPSISSSHCCSTSGLRASAQKSQVRKSWSGSGNWSLTVARICSSVVTPSSAAWRTRREIWSTASGSGDVAPLLDVRVDPRVEERARLAGAATGGALPQRGAARLDQLGLPDVAGLERAQDRLVGLLARQLLPVGLEVQPAERLPGVDGLAFAPRCAHRLRAAARDAGRLRVVPDRPAEVVALARVLGARRLHEDALAAVPARDAREAAAAERRRIVELDRALDQRRVGDEPQRLIARLDGDDPELGRLREVGHELERIRPELEQVDGAVAARFGGYRSLRRGGLGIGHKA